MRGISNWIQENIGGDTEKRWEGWGVGGMVGWWLFGTDLPDTDNQQGV